MDLLLWVVLYSLWAYSVVLIHYTTQATGTRALLHLHMWGLVLQGYQLEVPASSLQSQPPSMDEVRTCRPGRTHSTLHHPTSLIQLFSSLSTQLHFYPLPFSSSSVLVSARHPSPLPVPPLLQPPCTSVIASAPPSLDCFWSRSFRIIAHTIRHGTTRWETRGPRWRPLRPVSSYASFLCSFVACMSHQRLPPIRPKKSEDHHGA